MSENGGGWPPRPPQPQPQPPRAPQPLQPPGTFSQRPPQGRHSRQDPRRAELPPGAWRPDERVSPVPPEYQPVHHDPRTPDQRRQDDSPWRRTQRAAQPETGGWHQPAQASYDGDSRGDQFYSPDQYGDQDPNGDRFVPGFGEDSGGGYLEDEPVPTSRRAARSARAASQGYDDGYGGGGRRPRRRRFRWIAPLAALLVIVIPLAVGGYYAYSLYRSKYHPADFSSGGTGYVVVQVHQGDTPTSLGPELVQLGVVASSRAFVLAAEHSSSSGGLLPGFYGMHKQMKASLAYARLLDQKNLVQVTVTIPEGWRLSQVVAYLGAKSGIPLSQYQKVLNSPAQLDLPDFANGHPEGYLFPATYEVLPHETALGVLKGMVTRFDQEATTVNLGTSMKQVKLSPGQVITMASLVQAEGGKVSDFGKIARVIYNRLARKMPLQLDSTVLYGLQKYGIIASDADLASTSPYNTYKRTGLTPGPIDSPGNAAIEAVLHPAPGPWLYFVTVNPKTKLTLFTSSEAQFEQYRQELEKFLGKG